MCGIAGIFSLDGTPVMDARARITRMTELLHHRGPDSRGVYVSDDGVCALGTTRLGIVDPGDQTRQPLVSADGHHILAFNGELYNYEDLRAELAGQGARFHTKMDTEVLLEGLCSQGEDFLHRCDGMWAFAFYDARAKELLLSRDVMGERHLYYLVRGKELIFASEMRSILSQTPGSFEIDFEGFLTSLQYFAPAPGRSMIQGVLRMRSGCNIVARAGSGWSQQRHRILHPEKWFDFFAAAPSLDVVIAKFEEVFHKACRRRFPRDVSFYSTLSGGLDSSAIGLFVSDYGRIPVRTMCGVGYERPGTYADGAMTEYDASVFTAKKINALHDKVDYDVPEYVDFLKDLADNAYDGFYDNGTASYRMLARHARVNGAKVVLMAEGPDEFMGYPRDRAAFHIDRIYHANRPLFYFLKMMSATPFGRKCFQLSGEGAWVVPRFFSYSPFRFEPINKSWDAHELARLVELSEVRKCADHYGVMPEGYEGIAGKLDYAQLRALSYASFSLPDMYNLRTDKAFMAESVEARLPYQAPEMAEFLIALPTNFRFGPEGATTKYLLRKVVDRHIGPEIAYRKKRGFGYPMWDRPHVACSMHYEDTLRGSRIFRDFPLRKGLLDFLLRPENYDYIWPFYALARVDGSLRDKKYL